MKLSEITNPKLMSEGMVEPNALMSVKNIIQRGHANNTFEYVVVARFLQLLKSGEFYKESNPLFGPNITTSKELLDILKALPPEQMVSVATKLLDLLTIKDKDAYSFMINPSQEYAIWLRSFQHGREADD